MRKGFTLIELSIVLVIIGLIVGGVLTGQNLIAAAGVRATISQIGKYNTAVNTFRGKYGALPGDMDASVAKTFGFAARGTAEGEGDGNGVIEGPPPSPGYGGFCAGDGEVGMFWVDLTSANGLNVNLIDGRFNTAVSTPQYPVVTGSALDSWMPEAKIGGGNYVYVYSGGWGQATLQSDGNNYFGLSAVYGINQWMLNSRPGLTVAQAAAIDAKMDDGLPQSGGVMAFYLDDDQIADGASFNIGWAAGNDARGSYVNATNAPTTAATPYASTNCYDNNNVTGTQTYSMAKNANQVNCALSFRFQ